MGGALQRPPGLSLEAQSFQGMIISCFSLVQSPRRIRKPVVNPDISTYTLLHMLSPYCMGQCWARTCAGPGLARSRPNFQERMSSIFGPKPIKVLNLPRLQLLDVMLVAQTETMTVSQEIVQSQRIRLEAPLRSGKVPVRSSEVRAGDNLSERK